MSLRTASIPAAEAEARWFDNPTAATLLAELGANPPSKRTANYAFGEKAELYTDRQPDGSYRAGRPVRTLQKLYRQHGEKLVGPEWAIWAQDSVDAAIDRAIAEAARPDRCVPEGARCISR